MTDRDARNLEVRGGYREQAGESDFTYARP